MWQVHRIVVMVIILLTAMVTIAGAAEESAKSRSVIEEYFQKAKRDYLQKDFNSAADEIRKAAAYLKSEAEKGSVIGKEVLRESYQGLENLADEVKKGAVLSVKKIETSFARAYRALAANSFGKSKEAWAKKEMTKTGEELEAATQYLERGFSWADQKIQKVTTEVIIKSKGLSQKLKKGTGWVADEVSKGLKEAEAELDKFGKGISSK